MVIYSILKNKEMKNYEKIKWRERKELIRNIKKLNNFIKNSDNRGGLVNGIYM